MRLARMVSEPPYGLAQYARAVTLLNTLQSNAQIVDAVRRNRDEFNRHSIEGMRVLLSRAGLVDTDSSSTTLFQKLRCIHIVGTKGKGSCAAACEAILRRTHIVDAVTGLRRPLRTGLFTSPHLIEVRERIRIDGRPMAKGLLAKYLIDVYDRLKETAPDIETVLNPTFPAYFRFITLVAFRAFLSEHVDVAIIEAGVGGEYDSTNIVDPIVVGITSLGLDHINLLGPGIKEIAWHKAGAMKPSRPAFSSIQADPIATDVLLERQKEIKPSFLNFVNVDETLGQYFDKEQLQSEQMRSKLIGLSAKYQVSNVALAISLCQEWIKEVQPRAHELALENGMLPLRKMEELDKLDAEGVSYEIPAEVKSIESSESDIITKRFSLEFNADTVKESIKAVTWPGRAQVYVSPDTHNVKWYLDGAHTKESIPLCVDWFEEAAKLVSGSKGNVMNILIFNCTKGRDSYTLLDSLVDLHLRYPFTKVIFCSIDLYRKPIPDTDSGVSNVSKTENALKRTSLPVDQMMNDAIREKMLVPQIQMENDWSQLVKEKSAKLKLTPAEAMETCVLERVSSIEEALESADELSRISGNAQINALVTGSLYLVGGVLTVLGAPVV